MMYIVPVDYDCTVNSVAEQSSCQEEVKRSKALRAKVLVIGQIGKLSLAP